MINPPKLFTRLVQLFCRDEYSESVLGDLEEEFYSDVERFGLTKARIRYAWNVMRFFRPSIIKRLTGHLKLNLYGLLLNHIKTNIRSAKREKAFTLLNVFCLVIGFTACLYVGLHTFNQFQYDVFHEKATRIFRINQTFIWAERDELAGSTGPAVADAIRSEIPEFEAICRIHPLENIPLVHAVGLEEKVIFEEKQIRAVDSTFFDLFTFPLLKGNPQSALNHPNSVVLSEEMAYKYFNSTDILGKQLMIMDDEVRGTFQVTGVTQNVPANSHVTFDMLISMSSIRRLNWAHDSWMWTTFVTFGLLRPDANPSLVADKVAQVPAKYLEPFLVKHRGMTYKEFQESGETWDLFIQPLLDIHLSGGRVFSRLNPTYQMEWVYIKIIVAVLILLLSVINFVNLSTAKASRRSREVGVRKVLGSSHGDLMLQFILESVFYCLLAALLSIGLLKVFLDPLNHLFDLKITFSSLFQTNFLLVFAGFTLLIGLLAGAYPAFYLSAIQPVKSLKGQLSGGSNAGLVRNTLITLQFTVSIALIACAITVKEQVGFWLEMDLGFNRNNIIVIQNAERMGESMESFQNEVLTLPGVVTASLASDAPPSIWDGEDEFQIDGSEEHLSISYWVADENHADIYGLKFLAGRNYDRSKDHELCAVVSQSMVKQAGFTDPEELIGRHLFYPEFIKARIIGVMDDIETEINWEQRPLAILFNFDDYYRKKREISVLYSSSIDNKDLMGLIHGMEEKWRAIHPGMPMNYYFLDQRFESLFEPSIRLGEMIRFYSILAMIIAGLGLAGLIAYVTERRGKEIGIRKILGATVSSIVRLLFREFARLLIIGFLLATALSWYLMNQWKQDYEHQAPMSWDIFVVAGAAMLLVTVFTIGYQSLKSATANPVESLRDE